MAVVGAGVVGLCLAEALARRGANVVVVEAGRSGAAASAGNAGWVVPGLSSPLPAPGAVVQGLRWMLSPRGPLRIRPSLRPAFARFLLDFRRNCSPRRHAAGLAATLALSGRVLQDFDALAARLPRFEMHRRGVLFVAASAAAIEAEAALLRQLQGHGYAGAVEVLDRAGAQREEPRLTDSVAGAVLAPAECHLRPESLIGALVARLGELGVELREGEPVNGLLRRSAGWSLRCERDPILARRVVLAAGAATPTLLRGLGVRLPLEAAKGYSLTREPAPVQLRRPLYLLDSKVAVSPFDGALRLAGTLELGARSVRVGRRGPAAIEAAARRCLRGWEGGGKCAAWAGLRPLTPDGLPVIGPVPGHPDLHLATGHAMLGVTLAPTTAELLAPVVLDGQPSPELVPFSIARFAQRAGGAVRTSTEERT